jgi:galactokinase/mevalonate kinase-like predicted kinase
VIAMLDALHHWISRTMTPYHLAFLRWHAERARVLDATT